MTSTSFWPKPAASTATCCLRMPNAPAPPTTGPPTSVTPLTPAPTPSATSAPTRPTPPPLPADWIVLRPRVARHGRDYDTAQGALTLPELARILADAVDPADPTDAAGPAWRLHAIHRAAPLPTGADEGITYLVELADPATGEVRSAPSLAAYRHLQGCADPTPASAAVR